MDGTLGLLLAPFQLTPAQGMIFGVVALITMGIVRVIKGLGSASAMLPVWSLVVAVALCNLARFVMTGPELSVALVTIIGLVAGLVASGMWSGGRAMMQGAGGAGGAGSS